MSLGIKRAEAGGVGHDHHHRVTPWLCPPLAHSCSGRPIYGLSALESSWKLELLSTETFLSHPAQTESSAEEFLVRESYNYNGESLCCSGEPGEGGEGVRRGEGRRRWSGHTPRLDLAVNELTGSPSESRHSLPGSGSQ